jgi:hypothetical protein
MKDHAVEHCGESSGETGGVCVWSNGPGFDIRLDPLP